MFCAIHNIELYISNDISIYVPIVILPEKEGDMNVLLHLRYMHVIEFLFITLSFFVGFMVIRGLSRTALFHRNLCRIAQVGFTQFLGRWSDTFNSSLMHFLFQIHFGLYYPSATSRVILFLYQEGVLHYSGKCSC